MNEIKSEKEKIIKDKISTAVSKVKFINEIKTTLGEEIKKNPSLVKVIKKTRMERIKLFFKKFLTKF
jgi:hypothetical protein